MANDVLKTYLEYDETFFHECDENYKKEEAEKADRRKQAESHWKIIAKMAEERTLKKKSNDNYFG